MLKESRLSGNRSVEIALAEIRILTKNVYVERAERKLAEVCVRLVAVTKTFRLRLAVTFIGMSTYRNAFVAPLTIGTLFFVLLQEEMPVCLCLPPKEGFMGCLEDCVNRAVRHCAT